MPPFSNPSGKLWEPPFSKYAPKEDSGIKKPDKKSQEAAIMLIVTNPGVDFAGKSSILMQAHSKLFGYIETSQYSKAANIFYAIDKYLNVKQSLNIGAYYFDKKGNLELIKSRAMQDPELAIKIVENSTQMKATDKIAIFDYIGSWGKKGNVFSKAADRQRRYLYDNRSEISQRIMQNGQNIGSQISELKQIADACGPNGKKFYSDAAEAMGLAYVKNSKGEALFYQNTDVGTGDKKFFAMNGQLYSYNDWGETQKKLAKLSPEAVSAVAFWGPGMDEKRRIDFLDAMLTVSTGKNNDFYFNALELQNGAVAKQCDLLSNNLEALYNKMMAELEDKAKYALNLKYFNFAQNKVIDTSDPAKTYSPYSPQNIKKRLNGKSLGEKMQILTDMAAELNATIMDLREKSAQSYLEAGTIRSAGKKYASNCLAQHCIISAIGISEQVNMFAPMLDGKLDERCIKELLKVRDEFLQLEASLRKGGNPNSLIPKINELKERWEDASKRANDEYFIQNNKNVYFAGLKLPHSDFLNWWYLNKQQAAIVGLTIIAFIPGGQLPAAAGFMAIGSHEISQGIMNNNSDQIISGTIMMLPFVGKYLRGAKNVWTATAGASMEVGAVSYFTIGGVHGSMDLYRRISNTYFDFKMDLPEGLIYASMPIGLAKTSDAPTKVKTPEQIKEAKYRKILGVDENAPMKKINTAWRAKVGKYEDALNKQGTTEKEINRLKKIEKKLQTVNEAYNHFKFKETGTNVKNTQKLLAENNAVKVDGAQVGPNALPENAQVGQGKAAPNEKMLELEVRTKPQLRGILTLSPNALNGFMLPLPINFERIGDSKASISIKNTDYWFEANSVSGRLNGSASSDGLVLRRNGNLTQIGKHGKFEIINGDEIIFQSDGKGNEIGCKAIDCNKLRFEGFERTASESLGNVNSANEPLPNYSLSISGSGREGLDFIDIVEGAGSPSRFGVLNTTNISNPVFISHAPYASRLVRADGSSKDIARGEKAEWLRNGDLIFFAKEQGRFSETLKPYCLRYENGKFSLISSVSKNAGQKNEQNNYEKNKLDDLDIFKYSPQTFNEYLKTASSVSNDAAIKNLTNLTNSSIRVASDLTALGSISPKAIGYLANATYGMRQSDAILAISAISDIFVDEAIIPSPDAGLVTCVLEVSKAISEAPLKLRKDAASLFDDINKNLETLEKSSQDPARRFSKMAEFARIFSGLSEKEIQGSLYGMQVGELILRFELVSNMNELYGASLSKILLENTDLFTEATPESSDMQTCKLLTSQNVSSAILNYGDPRLREEIVTKILNHGRGDYNLGAHSAYLAQILSSPKTVSMLELYPPGVIEHTLGMILDLSPAYIQRPNYSRYAPFLVETLSSPEFAQKLDKPLAARLEQSLLESIGFWAGDDFRITVDALKTQPEKLIALTEFISDFGFTAKSDYPILYDMACTANGIEIPGKVKITNEELMSAYKGNPNPEIRAYAAMELGIHDYRNILEQCTDGNFKIIHRIGFLQKYQEWLFPEAETRKSLQVQIKNGGLDSKALIASNPGMDPGKLFEFYVVEGLKVSPSQSNEYGETPSNIFTYVRQVEEISTDPIREGVFPTKKSESFSVPNILKRYSIQQSKLAEYSNLAPSQPPPGFSPNEVINNIGAHENGVLIEIEWIGDTPRFRFGETSYENIQDFKNAILSVVPTDAKFAKMVDGNVKALEKEIFRIEKLSDPDKKIIAREHASDKFGNSFAKIIEKADGSGSINSSDARGLLLYFLNHGGENSIVEIFHHAGPGGERILNASNVANRLHEVFNLQFDNPKLMGIKRAFDNYAAENPSAPESKMWVEYRDTQKRQSSHDENATQSKQSEKYSLEWRAKTFVDIAGVYRNGSCLGSDYSGLGQRNVLIGRITDSKGQLVGSVVTQFDPMTKSLTIIDLEPSAGVITRHGSKNIKGFVYYVVENTRKYAEENGLELYLHHRSDVHGNFSNKESVVYAFVEIYGPFDHFTWERYVDPVAINSYSFPYGSKLPPANKKYSKEYGIK